MKTFTHSLCIAGLMAMLALGLTAAAPVAAQTTEDDPRFYLGLHGHAGIPVGEFGGVHFKVPRVVTEVNTDVERS